MPILSSFIFIATQSQSTAGECACGFFFRARQNKSACPDFHTSLEAGFVMSAGKATLSPIQPLFISNFSIDLFFKTRPPFLFLFSFKSRVAISALCLRLSDSVLRHINGVTYQQWAEVGQCG
mgnify:FL=1